jgi:hypothetical protein
MSEEGLALLALYVLSEGREDVTVATEAIQAEWERLLAMNDAELQAYKDRARAIAIARREGART